jgi:hypothetical protein
VSKHVYGKKHGHIGPVLTKIRALKIGEQSEVEPNAYVKRKKQNEYVLIDRNNRERSRWGTANEIATDVHYYMEHGHLPAPLGSRW